MESQRTTTTTSSPSSAAEPPPPPPPRPQTGSRGQSARSVSRASSSSRSSHRPPDVAVPSFSAFCRRTGSGRATPPVATRAEQAADTTSRSARRTSLPSPSSTQHVSVTVPSRSASVDSPTPRKLVHEETLPAATYQASPVFAPRDLDLYPHGHTPGKPSLDSSIDERIRGIYPHSQSDTHLLPVETYAPHPSRSSINRSSPSFHTAQNSFSDYNGGASPETVTRSRGSSMSARSRTSPKPPGLTLQLDDELRTIHPGDSSPPGVKTPPKSPGGKISSFFGWKQQPSQADSPTTFADSLSPAPSPMILNYGSGAMALPDSTYTSRSTSPNPYRGAGASPDDELLAELREITAELAGSIRREMDLEDELDRARTEMPTGPMEHQRRTSDYYSDSGASSTRMPLADSETKIEGLEKMRRKAEQEKAQLRLEMAQKAQEDLNHRKALELHVQSLEEQLQSSQRPEASLEESSERTRELEVSLEDAKRRLNEEKQFKENFEDLIRGMREEIEGYRNERDNLRDEVVPQLKARVEGLEAEAAQLQTLAYEHTRLQQENQNLINENQTLVNARKLQLDLQNSNGRFQTISEGDEPMSPTARTGLVRSGSLARRGSQRHRSGSLSKGGKEGASAEGHSDSLKDVEDQRDALHRTLKALILRQDLMTREHARRMRRLEIERDTALNSTPRRAAFSIEVQHLRAEVNQLRRRADEALDQKWQCEKGLSGLKMDLDRAQQETSSLRDLLQDIFVPGRPLSGGSDGSIAGSETLEQTYAKLRSTHADSVARLQHQTGDGAETPEKLDAAESRMKALSAHIENQIASNHELRARFADAISRGEQDQETSAKKIVDLQAALKAAEDRLASAQTLSEEAVTQQEEHIKAMRGAEEEKEKRGVVRSPTEPKPSPGNSGETLRSLSTYPSTLFSSKSPRIDLTSSGPSTTVAGTTKAEALEARVRELEQAASRADGEMQGVVEKMNRAQMEVAELQTQRDEAMRQTRRLQREIVAERERFKALTA